MEEIIIFNSFVIKNIHVQSNILKSSKSLYKQIELFVEKKKALHWSKIVVLLFFPFIFNSIFTFIIRLIIIYRTSVFIDVYILFFFLIFLYLIFFKLF